MLTHLTRPLMWLSLALTLGLLGLSPPTTSAAPGLGTGTNCFPGTVTTNFGYTTYHNCTTETPTPSGGLSVTFNAHVTAPSIAPAQTITMVGFNCLTSRGPTSISSVTITPDGKVSGTCKR